MYVGPGGAPGLEKRCGYGYAKTKNNLSRLHVPAPALLLPVSPYPYFCPRVCVYVRACVRPCGHATITITMRYLCSRAVRLFLLH